MVNVLTQAFEQTFVTLGKDLAQQVIPSMLPLLSSGDSSVSGKTPLAATHTVLSGEAQLLKVTLALVFVLGIIYFFAWLIRKNQGIRSFVGQPFRTLAMSNVGPKERIALIEIGSKQILLGITPHNINALATFDEPVMQVKDKAETDFAKKLKDIISHGRAEQ